MKSKLLALMVIACYLLLLAPTVILSNAGESGIVLESQSVQYQSIPRDIQDLLPHQNEYHITIIDDPASEEQYAVISKQMPYHEGSFVQVNDPTSEWYSDSHILSSIVHHSFDRVIIGKVEEVGVGGGFAETVVQEDILRILSSIDFLVGGFFLIMILSVLSTGSVALWNVPGIVSCYSFQFFCTSAVASLNQVDVDEIYMAFGLLFVVLIPLTIWLQRYEESDKGQQKIYEVYTEHKRILSKLKAKFGM